MDYVNKLRITSVHLPNLSGSALAVAASIASAAAQTAAGGIFELTINPEQYIRNFTIQYDCPPEAGASPKKKESQFKGVTPEVLDLKFTIDGTGVVPFQQPAIDIVTQIFIAAGPDAQVAFVAAKLTQLKSVVYDIQSESHRPPFMLVNWGKLVFMGELQGMTETYTLFHPTGLPLRVEVSMKIQEYKMSSVAAAAMSLLSPDLTKKRTVKSSDTLLTMTKAIYDKPDYYLEVAKANEIDQF